MEVVFTSIGFSPDTRATSALTYRTAIKDSYGDTLGWISEQIYDKLSHPQHKHTFISVHTLKVCNWGPSLDGH